MITEKMTKLQVQRRRVADAQRGMKDLQLELLRYPEGEIFEKLKEDAADLRREIRCGQTAISKMSKAARELSKNSRPPTTSDQTREPNIP